MSDMCDLYLEPGNITQYRGYKKTAHQLCQLKNYSLLYALYTRSVNGPPPVQWGLLGHPSLASCDALPKLTPAHSVHDHFLLPTTVQRQQPKLQNKTRESYNLNNTSHNFLPYIQDLSEFDCRADVNFRSIKVVFGCDDPRVAIKGFDPRLRHDRFVDFAAVVFCFNFLICNFKIVFTWSSTQGKRKLWLRISLVSREPS